MSQIHIPHDGQHEEKKSENSSLNLRSREYTSGSMEEPVHEETTWESFKDVMGKVFFITKFLVVTTFIFVFILTALNFHAYKQIALSFVNPQSAKKVELALEETVKETVKKQNLLKVNRTKKQFKKVFSGVGF